MDGSRFDDLTRSLARSSRRSLLGAALGGALALVGLGGADAATRKRKPSQVCRKDGDCASGTCLPKDGTGRRRCACASVADCPAGDQCRAAACTAGVCELTVKENEPCDDGNACTTGDTCNANGRCVGTPVVCSASDQCHAAGVCDRRTGQCTNPPKADGTACDDGNACTQTDTCQAGVCTGGNPVVCTALDQCHVAGTCNPTTGVCSNPPASPGTPCSNGNACTTGETCQSGVCTGGQAVACPPGDICDAQAGCTCTSGADTCTGLRFCGGSNSCGCLRTLGGSPACVSTAGGCSVACSESSPCPNGFVCTFSPCCDQQRGAFVCNPLCGA